YMTHPILDQLNIDNLIQRYKSGETVAEIASDIGVSHNTVGKRLNKHIVMRKAGTRRMDIDAVTSMYTEDKLSGRTIAKQMGVSERLIYNRMEEAGVQRRPGWEDNVIAWSAAGAKAKLGKPRSRETSEKIALTKELRRAVREGPDEVRLIDLLEHKGLSVIPQKAIGVYNVDIALAESPVVVEVFSHTSLPPGT